MDLQKNKVYRCQITDYTADGTGFAKIEGRAVLRVRQLAISAMYALSR